MTYHVELAAIIEKLFYNYESATTKVSQMILNQQLSTDSGREILKDVCSYEIAVKHAPFSLDMLRSDTYLKRDPLQLRSYIDSSISALEDKVFELLNNPDSNEMESRGIAMLILELKKVA